MWLALRAERQQATNATTKKTRGRWPIRALPPNFHLFLITNEWKIPGPQPS